MVAVADPGFPRGEGANPKGGAPTYYLANFSRKLHENEEILGQRGGRASLAPPLRSATGLVWSFCPIIFGPCWGPRDVIYCSVNIDRVVKLPASDGHTATQWYYVIEVVSTFCDQVWQGQKNLVYTVLTNLMPLHLSHLLYLPLHPLCPHIPHALQWQIQGFSEGY